MITVIGMWEPGYSAEQTFFEDTVWKQVINAYNVDRFVMVAEQDTRIANLSVPEQFNTMEEALASSTGNRVFLTFSEIGATSLRDFIHPENAIYIFGRPGDNLQRYITDNDYRVHIVTPSNIDMLACSCISAVLYARSI